MSKSPTLKQIEKCMKRIEYHVRHLQAAMNDAHRRDIISYEAGKYSELAPCWALSELEHRVELTTQKAIATAFRRKINNEVPWPKY